MRKFYLITLLTACLAVTKAPACTNFLLTKGATKDGSTMITYAADSHVLYGELYHWPAGTWAEGTMMDIYEWDTGKYMGQIPQASQTYNVIGNMNEFQLAIGETTYGGLEELASQSGAIMDYGSLIYTTLQRAKTAREAIVVMTDLVAKYGYARRRKRSRMGSTVSAGRLCVRPCQSGTHHNIPAKGEGRDNVGQYGQNL